MRMPPPLGNVISTWSGPGSGLHQLDQYRVNPAVADGSIRISLEEGAGSVGGRCSNGSSVAPDLRVTEGRLTSPQAVVAVLVSSMSPCAPPLSPWRPPRPRRSDATHGRVVLEVAVVSVRSADVGRDAAGPPWEHAVTSDSRPHPMYRDRSRHGRTPQCCTRLSRSGSVDPASVRHRRSRTSA